MSPSICSCLKTIQISITESMEYYHTFLFERIYLVKIVNDTKKYFILLDVHI